MRRKAWGCLVVVAALAAPGVASGETMSCGQAVTHDAVLGNDLQCATGPALRVTGNEIALDLAGRSVSASDGSPGIVVTGNDDAVRNGYADVVLSGRRDRVAWVKAGAIAVRRGVDAVIAHVSVAAETRTRTARLVLDHDRGTTVRRADVDLVTLSSSRDATIGRSRLRHVVIDAGTRGATLQGDLLSSSFPQLEVLPPSDPPHRLELAGDGNVVRGTTILRSSGAAVTVTGRHNELDGDTIEGAGGDGVQVTGHGNTLRGNTARANAVLGIDARPGTVDAGANRASHNGTAAQCAGVRCAPEPTVGTLSDCDQQISQDVVLEKDLTCDTGGIAAVANGVTVDLGGHYIAPYAGPDITVDAHDDVTIRNGFAETAFQTPGIFNPDGGFVFVGGHRNRVENVANGLSRGVVFTGGSDNTVSGSQLFGEPQQNIPWQGGTFYGEADDVVDGDWNDELYLSNVQQTVGVSGMTVRDSLIQRAFFVGDGNLLERSWGYTGDLRLGGVGFRGDDNVAAGNHLLDVQSLSVNSGSGNELSGNVVDAWFYGDGIHVGTAGNTITRNVARNNAALGIDAVAGNTDGGGNRASGNGDPRQCAGVACAAP